MKLPISIKLPFQIPASLAKKLPMIGFILLIPAGVALGYFFSNIKQNASNGFSDILKPIYKIFYIAKVDGVGISRSEWGKVLERRYGQSAASDLINVYMIKNEIKKAGISVSDEEIDAEIANIEKQLGGQSIGDALKERGSTMEDLRSDVWIQLGVTKMFSSKITITDQEVDEYVTALGTSLTGATDEEKKESARKILTDQKVGEEASTWFSQIQPNIKVENYLE